MSETANGKKQVPIRPGMFRIPDEKGRKPYLYGVKCKNCGTFFFPVREVCLNCGAENMEEASMGGRGKIYTYTIVRQQVPGALVQVPYAIAIVLMEEGCQVHTVITEGWESLRVDMDVEVYFEKMGEDDQGNDQLAYKFKAI